MPAPIRLEVLANASQARREIDSFADNAERSTGRVRGALGKVGKALALGVGAGVVAATAAGVKFAQAAIEDEQSANRMAQAFKANANATKGQIAATEEWITKQGKQLGVADDELRPALSRLVTATKDVGEAQKLTSLAMDVSAGSGKSLESVSTALMKAQNGQVSALSRLGINTKDAEGKTISMAEATKRMTDTFGGAAQANADTLGGKVERLKLMASEAGETIGAKMLPLLTTFVGWVLSTGIPAISSIASSVQEWASGMAERLSPVISAVSSFVTGTLIPAISGFASYVMSTVVPAVVDIATKVATNLSPVIVALVGNVRNIIAKFREWQPTITAVISVVAKIIGKVLEFASAILGTVLPPLIKFASFMTVTVFGAVVAVIGVVARIITKIADFGGAVLDGARKVGEFAGKVQDKIADVVTYFTNLPGKITGALSGAKNLLVETGKNIVQGLINGIDSVKQWVIDKVQALADLVPGWIRRRLGIASPSKVTRRLGEWAGQGLADGITAMRGKVSDAADKAAEKVIERLKGKLDNARGVRDSIKSLAGSIGDSLTGDLFGGRDDESGTALDKFRASVAAAKATSDKVKKAVKSLIDRGVSSDFLNKLTTSGNTDLILQLEGAGDAKSLAESYEAVAKQNEETGRLVAEQVIGTRLDIVNSTIANLVQEIRTAQQEARADKRRPVEVRFTSEQLDQLSRGRAIRADLDAWDNTGGRRSA